MDLVSSLLFHRKKASELSNAFESTDESTNLSIKPKPHGRGWICPHFCQRPITQKILKCKKLAQNTHSMENFC